VEVYRPTPGMGKPEPNGSDEGYLERLAQEQADRAIRTIAILKPQTHGVGGSS